MTYDVKKNNTCKLDAKSKQSRKRKLPESDLIKTDNLEQLRRLFQKCPSIQQNDMKEIRKIPAQRG